MKPQRPSAGEPSPKAAPFHDDGHTVADMNVPGAPWYRKRPASSPGAALRLTRGERWAMFRALCAVIAPILLSFLAFMALVLLLLQATWLS